MSRINEKDALFAQTQLAAVLASVAAQSSGPVAAVEFEDDTKGRLDGSSFLAIPVLMVYEEPEIFQVSALPFRPRAVRLSDWSVADPFVVDSSSGKHLLSPEKALR